MSRSAAGRSATGSFIAKRISLALWHILGMAASIIGQYSLQYRGRIGTPRNWRSAPSMFFLEIADPAVAQHLTGTNTQVTQLSGDFFALGRPQGLWDAVIKTNLTDLSKQNNYNAQNNETFKLLVAYHLFGVFCAFEAQMPKNVIHQMHQVVIDQFPSLEYWGFCIRVHTPRNNCIISGPERQRDRDEER
jgi:hypothetical protein